MWTECAWLGTCCVSPCEKSGLIHEVVCKPGLPPWSSESITKDFGKGEGMQQWIQWQPGLSELSKTSCPQTLELQTRDSINWGSHLRLFFGIVPVLYSSMSSLLWMAKNVGITTTVTPTLVCEQLKKMVKSSSPSLTDVSWQLGIRRILAAKNPADDKTKHDLEIRRYKSCTTWKKTALIRYQHQSIWKFRASHFSHLSMSPFRFWSDRVREDVTRPFLGTCSPHSHLWDRDGDPHWLKYTMTIHDDETISCWSWFMTSQDVIILCLFCCMNYFIYYCMISLGHIYIYIYIYLIIMMMVYWTSSCDSPAHPGLPSWGRCCSRSHEFTGWGNHHECGPYLRLVLQLVG